MFQWFFNLFSHKETSEEIFENELNKAKTDVKLALNTLDLSATNVRKCKALRDVSNQDVVTLEIRAKKLWDSGQVAEAKNTFNRLQLEKEDFKAKDETYKKSLENHKLANDDFDKFQLTLNNLNQKKIQSALDVDLAKIRTKNASFNKEAVRFSNELEVKGNTAQRMADLNVEKPSEFETDVNDAEFEKWTKSKS